MNFIPAKIIRRLAAAVLLGSVCMNVSAVELPPVPNVQLNGNLLTWEPLEGATGYNIYNGSSYLSTVQDAFEYTLTDVGTYSVIAFNDEGDFGAIAGSTMLFFADGVDNRPIVGEIVEGFYYVTQRCDDVATGDSCVASCPDFVGVPGTLGFFIGGATGGACSSSDSLAVHSSVGPGGYACTATSFTSRIEAQAVCSAEAREE